jgi:hypothetical protein
MKRIYNKPRCKTYACCNHNPEYPNHCEIWDSVEICCLAEVEYPNHIQRALAWIDNHWVGISFAFAIATLIICWSVFMFGAGASAAIDDLRAEQQIAMQQCKGKR